MCCVAVLFWLQILWGMSDSACAECLRLDPNQAPYFSIPDKQQYKDKEDHPLIVAAWMGNRDVVQCWLDAGTNADIEGFRGDTALMRAAMFGHARVVGALLKAGADANKKNEAGQTALHFLARASDNINLTGIAQLLLDAHADVNVMDKLGETPLKIAMTQGVAYKSTYPDHHKLSLLLIKRGADLKPVADDPWPPLLLAILHQDVEMVGLLLKHGADPNMRNPYKQSALDIAKSRKNNDIIQLLKMAGATSSDNAELNPEPLKNDGGPEYKLEMEFVGKTVVIKPEWPGVAYLSNSPEEWFKDDSTVSVKANLSAEILETRAYWPDSDKTLYRFKVRTEEGQVGWLSLQDLLCTSVLCDDNHPQRRFPFDIQ